MLLLQPGAFGGRDSGGRGWGERGGREERWDGGRRCGQTLSLIHPEPHSLSSLPPPWKCIIHTSESQGVTPSWAAPAAGSSEGVQHFRGAKLGSGLGKV